jgi:hypothetical protein
VKQVTVTLDAADLAGGTTSADPHWTVRIVYKKGPVEFLHPLMATIREGSNSYKIVSGVVADVKGIGDNSRAAWCRIIRPVDLSVPRSPLVLYLVL